ncbi:hypothetical protein IMCC3135_01275 [Granulosicoccus antarcticus IMCC3135]|uniref:Uncharacterized protein n=2 Tax=Granulosicoccus TaxID=437504 RepID=A0A2Z2NTD0_9GAMM|nr:hypothetical protein IMCC3135_01275 [Granulosicoccus antarcticus IMCC3135]
MAVAFTDVYYIRTITEAGPVHLEASQRYGSNRIGGETIDPLPIANEAFAWRFTGGDILNIESQNRLIEPTTTLVVRANDGIMQVAMVDDGAADRELSNWRLVPLGNGRCHLINESLGSDLALTITDGFVIANDIERYSVEMLGIDDALNQQWTIVRVGNPPGDYAQFCGEVLVPE